MGEGIEPAAADRGLLVMASVYIKGAELSPAWITSCLNVEPDDSHIRGDPVPRVPGRLFKIGLWMIGARLDCADGSRFSLFDRVIDEVLERLTGVSVDISKLEGVESAYLDVFWCRSLPIDQHLGKSVEFCVSASVLHHLAALGLDLSVTASNVHE